MKFRDITINSFTDCELYSIAARLYYYYYLSDDETFIKYPQECINQIKAILDEDHIQIRNLSDVDQYLANDCNIDDMSETYAIIQPGYSYADEVNLMIHNERLRWKKWHG